MIQLPTQVWSSRGGPPSPDRVQQVANRPDHWKCLGGLWTSSLEDGGSEWTRWCEGEGFGDYASHWLLEPAPSRVAVVATPDDLAGLHARFPRDLSHLGPEASGLRMFSQMLDYEAVASEYDALHVPDPWPWRFGDTDGAMFFYVMDAECTVWFRWRFGAPVEL